MDRESTTGSKTQQGIGSKGDIDSMGKAKVKPQWKLRAWRGRGIKGRETWGKSGQGGGDLDEQEVTSIFSESVVSFHLMIDLFGLQFTLYNLINSISLFIFRK